MCEYFIIALSFDLNIFYAFLYVFMNDMINRGYINICNHFYVACHINMRKMIHSSNNVNEWREIYKLLHTKITCISTIFTNTVLSSEQ